MVKYVIHKDFFKDNLARYYSFDEILGIKKPSTTKFQRDYDIAARRIAETYEFLGPVHVMKDQCGHKFSKIYDAPPE